MATSLLINDGNVVRKPFDHSQCSMNKNEGTKSAVLHRSLHHDPLRVVAATGNYLHLSNGQRIFDATGGAAVACLGHGNKRYRYIIRQRKFTADNR